MTALLGHHPVLRSSFELVNSPFGDNSEGHAGGQGLKLFGPRSLGKRSKKQQRYSSDGISSRFLNKQLVQHSLRATFLSSTGRKRGGPERMCCPQCLGARACLLGDPLLTTQQDSL